MKNQLLNAGKLVAQFAEDHPQVTDLQIGKITDTPELGQGFIATFEWLFVPLTISFLMDGTEVVLIQYESAMEQTFDEDTYDAVLTLEIADQLALRHYSG